MTYAEVLVKHGPSIRGEKAIYPYIVLVEVTPIGKIQCRGSNQVSAVSAADDVADIDLLMGQADSGHKGLGSLLLRRFLAEGFLATPGVNRCAIDPTLTSNSAFKAFRRAGFEY